jgi:hypothetical protein
MKETKAKNPYRRALMEARGFLFNRLDLQRPLAPALIAMSKAITREMPAVRERSRDYILFYLVIVVMECTNEFELYYTCVFI